MTYKEFIQNIIDTRGQWALEDGYWEGHHIVPTCKGGEGNSRFKHINIIRLYAREHYEAHRLLALENSNDWNLVNAFHCIAHMCADTNKRIITAEEYEEAKMFMSECIKNNYPYTIECIENKKLYKCPSDAGKDLNIKCYNHIAECCRGKRATCNGYHFRYFNCDEFNQKIIKHLKNKGPVRCIETGIVYDYLKDIFDDYNKMCKVLDCCNGKSCTAYGYHWEFVDDNMKCKQKIDRRSFGRQNWPDDSKEHYKLMQRLARANWSDEMKNKEKLRKSKTSKGRKWYTNGNISRFCFPGEEPEGFRPGRLTWKEI